MMASKMFPSSRLLLAQIFSSAHQTTRHLLQSQTATATASRALSSFPLFGTTSSNINHKSPKHVCSLFACGSQCQGTVLANGFKPIVLQVRSYECRLRPRLICDGCYFVWRHNRRFVECSDHPSHKQMKRIATRKVWQEDYSKGDVEKAMDWTKRFPREFARNVDRTSVSHNWLVGKIGKEI